MLSNASGFGILLALALASALVVYGIVFKSLRDLLGEVINLPSATTFYTRLFGVGLIFLTIASEIQTKFDLKTDAVFMEYVWRIAGGLSSLFWYTLLFLLAYLVLVTVLIAALRVRHDQ